MIGWKDFKRGFDTWEQLTAEYLEKVLQNPAVLTPAGTLLTFALRSKVATDKAAAAWWGALGLPTKRDQERTLHALNQLQSRLLDLEERLGEREEA